MRRSSFNIYACSLPNRNRNLTCQVISRIALNCLLNGRGCRRLSGRDAFGALLGHVDATIGGRVALGELVERRAPGGIRAIPVDEDPDDLGEEQAEELGVSRCLMFALWQDQRCTSRRSSEKALDKIQKGEWKSTSEIL